MTNRNTEEKLRKLAALDPRFADKNWLFYLAGMGEERDEADDLIDVLLFQNAKKDFREQIFLEPPPAEDCVGEYVLGDVLYPPGTVHGSFGLASKKWRAPTETGGVRWDEVSGLRGSSSARRCAWC